MIGLEDRVNESNNELEKLAAEVLSNYSVLPRHISIVQSGSIKTVWKVRAEGGDLCLKRLKQTYDKALFSVNAQIHIKNAGGNVPSIIHDKSGMPIVQYNSQLFVVYEWLEGRNLDFNKASDLEAAVRGLALFHSASRGYIPPEGCRVSSKLQKWPEQYDSMKRKIADWMEIAAANISLPYHLTYLKYAESIVELSDRAIDLLGKSGYAELASPQSDSVVICHQDYGKGNAILTENGVYVLDLDGATFDLPARDLRKIIGKRAEIAGVWDMDMITRVIKWYVEANPLSQEEINILYIDLLYPHWYYGLVKNLYKNNKALKAAEIKKIAELELSKVQVIETLLKKR